MDTLTKVKNELSVRNFFPRSFFTDDFFNPDWPTNFFSTRYLEKIRIPAANLKENDQSFIVELSVPGYTKKDISVSIENNMLVISGERKEEKKDEQKNYTRQEFSQDSFYRTFELPSNVNAANIAAKCTDGLLCVDLPKSQSSESKKKITTIPVS